MVTPAALRTRRAAFGLTAGACTAAAAAIRPLRSQPTPANDGGGVAAAPRPTRMLCPGTAGSGVDLAARILADGLSRRRGHPIAVDGRPGADGTLAAGAFALARPGEALFFTFSDVLTVAPLMHERLPYDPLADFVPVSTAVDGYFALAVAGALPAPSLAELTVLARARPGALNWFATPGTPYLAFRAFLRDAGVDMAFVSYRGAPAALLDLAAGRIQAVLTPLAPALGPAAEGRIRLLAVTAPERATTAPDLPTTTEAGMPGFQIRGLLGLFGWRGFDGAAREELAAQTRAVLAEPAAVERLRAAGMRARGSTPAEYEAELVAQRAHWGALAREFGARPPA